MREEKFDMASFIMGVGVGVIALYIMRFGIM